MHSWTDFVPSDWTLDKALQWRVGLSPDTPFLSFEGREETFAEVYGDARRIAYGLSAAYVTHGSRVILFTRNSIDTIKIWFAINLLGAVDAPVNPNFQGRLLVHAINLIDTPIIIADKELLPILEAQISDLPTIRQIYWIGEGDVGIGDFGAISVLPLTDLKKPDDDWIIPGAQASDLCSILFTSGTTGPAKGVMLTQAQAFLTARQTLEGLAIGNDDIVYCSHPLFHMSPRFCAIYAAILAGAKVCLDKQFSAQHWIDRIRETKATVTIGHGPLLEMIFNQPERPDDADTCLTRIGTSPFPKHIAAAFEKRFGVKGIETWGMTEINIPCWHPLNEPLRPGSCGRIRDEWYDFRVIDPVSDLEVPRGTVGEFAVRPKLPWIISPGYFRNPESTLSAWRNLWFHTGDSGYIDHEGWVYFTDRLGDRIRRRAENISSYDIEIAANAYPAILESAAIGVPSEFASDDDVKLCVVIRESMPFNEAEFLRYLALQLPHHMVPRYIERLEALPRTPTQKIGKGQLRSRGLTETTWDRKCHGIDMRSLIAENRDK